MTLTIVPVTSRAEVEEFIRLPAVLYCGLDGYVPSLTIERRAVLDPKRGPFFSHGRAQYWLARRDGRTVGRISAQIDDVQPVGTFNDAGLFGCLDAIDDVTVSAALLAAAENWLRGEGLAHVAGPFGLNMNSEPGFLADGFSEPPMSLVPWHPPYLVLHMAQTGYAACKDLHYWRASDISRLVAKAEAFKKRMRTMDLRTRRFDPRNLAADIDILRELYNDAWQDNWGFVPLQPADIAPLLKDMRPYVRPEFGAVVEKDGRPVGAGLYLPNLHEITAGLGSDPSPLGWAKLGYRTLFHRFRTGFVILLGIRSDVRHSVGGAAIALTLVNEMIGRTLGYNPEIAWIEAGWVLDNNVALQKILQQYGFEKKRTLRLFEKSLLS